MSVAALVRDIDGGGRIGPVLRENLPSPEAAPLGWTRPQEEAATAHLGVGFNVRALLILHRLVTTGLIEAVLEHPHAVPPYRRRPPGTHDRPQEGQKRIDPPHDVWILLSTLRQAGVRLGIVPEHATSSAPGKLDRKTRSWVGIRLRTDEDDPIEETPETPETPETSDSQNFSSYARGRESSGKVTSPLSPTSLEPPEEINF